MTVDLPAELAPLLGDLWPGQLEHLSAGPMREPTCRVCTALLWCADVWLAGKARTTGQHRAGAASLRLHDWHQALLGDSVAHEPLLTNGPVAYARCCAIYRAAGWQRSAALRWADMDGQDRDHAPPSHVAFPGPDDRCGDPLLDVARHWPTVPPDLAEHLRA